jgi:hypothetical protein
MFLPFVFGSLWMGLYPAMLLGGMHVLQANLIQQGFFSEHIS